MSSEPQEDPAAVAAAGRDGLSPALIALLKGVVHQDQHVEAWRSIVALSARIRDYTAVLGLELVLDESEGFAYLRQRTEDDDADDPDSEPLPRLVQRRALGFSVSLLLVLLRKKLAEHDAGQAGDQARLVLPRDRVHDLVEMFAKGGTDEVKRTHRIDADIAKAVELGFLRKLRAQDPPQYEVRRILKAFVDAQWIGEFEAQLGEYRAHLDGRTDADDGDEEAAE